MTISGELLMTISLPQITTQIAWKPLLYMITYAIFLFIMNRKIISIKAAKRD